MKDSVDYGESPVKAALDDLERVRSKSATEARINQAEAASRRAVEYGEPKEGKYAEVGNDR
jgi:hypothetical protein